MRIIEFHIVITPAQKTCVFWEWMTLHTRRLLRFLKRGPFPRTYICITHQIIVILQLENHWLKGGVVRDAALHKRVCAEVREWLEGNICRCTGYHNIVKSILAGAQAMKEG